MPTTFNPSNWYWFVAGDTTKVFSSAIGNYVLVSDPTYQAWVTQGNRTSTIASEQELYDLLVSAGVDPGILLNTVTVSTVPMWAFHAALAAFSGGDKEAVYDTWITTNKATRINLYFQWKQANSIQRTSNLVGSVVNQTGLTPTQMNAIFADAVTRAKNSGVN